MSDGVPAPSRADDQGPEAASLLDALSDRRPDRLSR
jgi:hypothetical protein